MDGSPLVLFGAHAMDIEAWAGIPRKSLSGQAETLGFQRTENPRRVSELASFYSDRRNVVANPLLCAVRDTSRVRFEAHTGQDETARYATGSLTIELPDLDNLTLRELIFMVREQLEQRQEGLYGRGDPLELIAELREREALSAPADDDQSLDSDAIEIDEEFTAGEEQFAFTSEDSTGSGAADEAVESDEPLLGDTDSHVQDFWDQLRARELLLAELETAGDMRERAVFAGYDRGSMISYLMPIILVDGQHRLLGAHRADQQAIADLISADELQQLVESADAPGGTSSSETVSPPDRLVRSLPVSLLLTPSPAEHVFHFVVVNQKATAIPKALLGTIVSTTLTANELDTVATRLEKAEIRVAHSRDIDYLARNPSSPFAGKVYRGVESDPSQLLDWLVLGSLVAVVRDLKGGKLYNDPLDHADRWKRNYLASSKLVGTPNDIGTAFELWSQLDGPWRAVFIAFFSTVRDRLADTKNEDAPNYWGRPRQSNLFNKVSLHILLADWFSWLCDRELSLDSVNDVRALVDHWLRNVDVHYFNRNWNLQGVKRDSTGIRRKWASLWVRYRKDPQRLPKVKSYGTALPD